MLFKFKIRTSRKQEMVGITDRVKEFVEKSKIKRGICVVYTPHATCGIIINENYDESVCSDILNKLEQIAPENGNYEHDKIDNNAHSHIKASIIGPNETIIIENGKLLLGTWQGIALAEFDGARDRIVFVKMIGE